MQQWLAFSGKDWIILVLYTKELLRNISDLGFLLLVDAATKELIFPRARLHLQ
jgi:hypothetical protein